MPLKPFLKSLLPSKHKSASKQHSPRHGEQDNDANHNGTTLVMTSWPDDKYDVRVSHREQRQSRQVRDQSHPNCLNISDKAQSLGEHRERGETSYPDTQRQTSITSDYKSLTPVSSVMSQLSSQSGDTEIGAEAPPEGLPELIGPEDNAGFGAFLSSDPFSSSDSGVQEQYPTVIERRRPTPEEPSSQRRALTKTGTKKEKAGESSPRQRPGSSRSSTKDGSLVAGDEMRSAQTTPTKSRLKNLISGRKKTSPPSSASSPASVSATVPLRSTRSPDASSSKSSHTVPVRRGKETEGIEELRRASGEVAGCDRAELPDAVSDAVPEEDVGAVDNEVFPEVALQTPIGALRKSRKRLCLMLNIEQPAIDTQWTPDYMGLAELLGFESLEIQNFWERNPADTLFLEWSRSARGSSSRECRRSGGSRLLAPVLATLLQSLEQLGRQDIVMECRGLILEDVSDYLAEQRLLESYTVARLQKFDCYVNIAEQDLLGVGRDILQNLEGVHGLRLCLTLRDVTLGGFEHEEMAKMLETRCDSKVLIVLTKGYEDSDACQFLTHFAVTLDPGSRKNKLIPLIVDEDTFVPRVLRCLAMLNYHRDKRLGFLWPRLKHAIKAPAAPALAPRPPQVTR